MKLNTKERLQKLITRYGDVISKISMDENIDKEETLAELITVKVKTLELLLGSRKHYRPLINAQLKIVTNEEIKWAKEWGINSRPDPMEEKRLNEYKNKLKGVIRYA